MLFLVVQLLKVAEVSVGAGLGLADLAVVAVLFLPDFMVLTIPISVLTGVLLGFGRLAQDGELVALAGAGVSARRLVAMPLFLGAIAAILAALVAGYLAPASADTLHDRFVELGKRHVAARLVPGRFFEDIPGLVLYPRKRASDGKTFQGFLMYDRSPERAHIVLARSARVRPDSRRDSLEVKLENGEVHRLDDETETYTLGSFDRASIGINIGRLVQDSARLVPPVQRKSSSALLAAADDAQLPPREQRLHLTAWHRRLAFPAAAVLFALLGTGLGASGRLRGRRRTLLAAVVVVAAYYLLMRLGDAVSEQRWLPPATAAWLPDMLVAVLGLWWLRKRAWRPR
jgi:lipopolysaccharide export system permease protein